MIESDGCRLGYLEMEEGGGEGKTLHYEFLKGGLAKQPSFILHGR